MPRALLFTYYFPPSAAAGARRWSDFTAIGAARGWHFDVVTLGSSSHIDAKGDNAASPIRVFEVPNSEHWFLRFRDLFSRFTRRIRSWRQPEPSTHVTSFQTAIAGGRAPEIADQVIRREDIRWELSMDGLRRASYAYQYHKTMQPWAIEAEAIGRRLAESNAYDVVISSGPPHVAHEVAHRIALGSNIPHVADFRDPWSQIDVVQENAASPLHYSLAGRAERRIAESAALLVMNTEPAADAMRAAYPGRRIITVRNGFDGKAVMPRHRDDRFIVTYAGAIYLDRDPRPLFAAARLALDTLGASPQAFRMRFIGDMEYGGVTLSEHAANAGVADFVEVVGYLQREVLHEYLAEAALLVNLPQGARLCIPSKVYEYLHFPAWLLAIEPSGTATRQLLEGTGADLAFSNDVNAIKSVLERRFREYMDGGRPKPLAIGDTFAMRTQAELFFNAVESGILNNAGRDRGHFPSSASAPTR